ncbi:MAG: fibronectin type III domain-containing protein [Candidatus Sumerlaeaceae bacterium]|nr:fibronectin type III domain-containing protein [Candidatus Sumerlaeaceae bacterium]
MLRKPAQHWCVTLAAAMFLASAPPAFADTQAFTITEDPALSSAIADARAAFLAMRAQNQPAFNRLDVVILVPNPDGTWRRGSYNPETIAYPASTVKLAYLAAAMYWCRTNGKPYTYLDADVRPMIAVSDNYATGRVVDTITGAPNDSSIRKVDDAFLAWYAKRLYTENYLNPRGLLENQTILHKTYPTNSGSSPSGAEQVAIDYRGGNRMQPKCAASLMLEIIEGAIEPGANAYMRELLTHERWQGDSVFGFGLPPGTVYENKLGVAYDTLEDIAHIVLPNGKRFILAAYSNAYSGSEPSQPYPYDSSILGVFCEKLIERLGYDVGCPPKLKIDDGGAGFSVVGSWTTGSAQAEKYGATYRYKGKGDGTSKAIWALNVPETGRYEVCVWYPEGTNRATDAPFKVVHANGATTIKVNQQKTGGRWFRLGDFDFVAGQGSVELSDAIADSAQIVVADAVKAVKWPTVPQPPAAPSNLRATAQSSTSIALTWQDNSSNEQNFILERKKGTGSYAVIATLNANTTSYLDTGLARSTTYTYRVKARNGSGDSAYSNEASATTPRK